MGCGKCHKHTTPLILTGYTNGCIKRCTRRCALYSFPLITGPSGVAIGISSPEDEGLPITLARFVWNQEYYGCYPLGIITISISQPRDEEIPIVDDGNFTLVIRAYDANDNSIVYINDIEITQYGIRSIPLEFNPNENSVIMFEATLIIHDEDEDGQGTIIVDGLNLDFVGDVGCSSHTYHTGSTGTFLL